MITPSFRENFYQALKEYNDAIVRPWNKQVTTYEARRGMFYTTLRRYVSMGSGRGRVEPAQFRCVFHEDGQLKSLKLLADLRYHYDNNWTDLMMLDELCIERKELYKEPIMNEIVDIVNSIK